MPVELPRAEPGTGSRTDLSPDVEVTAETEGPWCTVVWNDPVNLMSYVSYVFQSYFGYSEAKARTLMLEVHEQGRSAVVSGSREKVEQDTVALHSYGLWATFEKAGSE